MTLNRLLNLLERDRPDRQVFSVPLAELRSSEKSNSERNSPSESRCIASNILVARFKHLEGEGIVEKSRDAENWRAFLHAPTQKGRDLAPVLLEIIIWSGLDGDRSGKKQPLSPQARGLNMTTRRVGPET